MKRRVLALALLVAVQMFAQSGDILGAHDLSNTGPSPVRGPMSAACLYCHVPHSGIGKGPLWGQTLSSQIYTMYSSDTLQNTPVQPQLGAASSLCLSCHDGTVAPGQMVPYGQMTMTGTMTSTFPSGKLENSHPFSLKTPLKDSADLVASLAASGTTADNSKAVELINGSVECNSCHNPHNQRIDKLSPQFLVIDNTKSALCLACHETKPRTVNTKNNPLDQWTTSIHSTSGTLVAPATGLGGYSTVAEFGCSSCHVEHNAAAPAGLLRNPTPTTPNIDTTSQSCITCHNGGSNLSPQPLNVFSEMAKPGHPYATGANAHDANEPAVLNQNRHATCVDCHNAHASNEVVAFGLPPAVRASQNMVVGVDAKDGTTVVYPAVNQYENCLRCHGTSTGEATSTTLGYQPLWVASAPDRLNVIPQFNTVGLSSHPVMHDRNSGLAQPSLRPNMLNLDGSTPGRPMGTRLLCTDCHNADDNREFGGAGPNGPHGSKWTHILERRYEFSQTTAPGQLIPNLYPNPDLGTFGPYGMCAKCHDLSNVVANTSFTEHARHINDGFTCSTCHTAHGIGGTTSGITGGRLVNFDANVVAPNGATPIAYDRATNSCSLTCHNHPHQLASGASAKAH